jgi:drug/metabolite transporter (DMT)-like permease
MNGPPASGRGVGLAAAAVSAVAWGSAFPVLALAMAHIHPLWVSAIRFAIALPVLLVILICLEGARALRFDGKFWAMLFIGGGGIAGYNIFALAGMNISGAAHGALMFATVPLMTAVANAIRTRTMPPIATLACVVAAFLGIALVITGGDPAVLMRGGSVIGDGLLLLGSVAWVMYTIERAKYPTFSALRFTSLTMITGVLVIAIAAVVAMTWMHVAFPQGSQIQAAVWTLVYGGIVPVVGAMLLYNLAVGKIGPASTALFANAVPIVTIAIEAARGIHLTPVEYVGSAIVLAALIVNNLLATPRAHTASLHHDHPRIA